MSLNAQVPLASNLTATQGSNLTVPRKTGSTRIEAIDFTKGALVLIMVLYHWLNYFWGPEGFIYRYLRFLPPSFIFITGFLISHVYLSRVQGSIVKLTKRLIVRGFKILAIFITLNILKIALLPNFRDGAAISGYFSSRTIASVFTSGNVGDARVAAFNVLVPIGYLLIVCGCLMLGRARNKYIFHFAFAAAVLVTVIVDSMGLKSANLELLTVGMLGVSCGYIRIDKIDVLARFSWGLIAAYSAYLAVITIWEVNYVAQIVGVCLTLMLIYALGLKCRDAQATPRLVLLLGQYSLFGYIAQIAIVQLLYRWLGRGQLDVRVMGVSFVTACALTAFSVVTMDRARAKIRSVEVMYKAIFA